MTCQNCSAEVPIDQTFCGNCGHRVTAETVGSINDRLARVETQLDADSRTRVTNQNYLEVDTAEKVMTRVKAWTTLILYFAGIPATIALLALAVVWGKGAYDLHSIAAKARESVQLVLNEAKVQASQALSTANAAQTTSKQVNTDIQDLQRRLATLNSEVDTRSSEVKKLDEQIKNSQTRVEGLAATVNSQSQQVAHLSQQLTAAETQKSVTQIGERYPSLFGEHVALAQDGPMDPKKKKSGEVYVTFALVDNGLQKYDADKVAEAVESLKAHGYTVLFGGIDLAAMYTNHVAGLGASFGQSSCSLDGTGVHTPPCILYFKEELREKAIEIKNLVSPAQVIPDDKIRFVQPKSMVPLYQDLLQKSAVDIVVVLGQV
jgi:hypothetical protein